jgi:ABC-type phosphate transport system substrate-binding protein
MRVLPILALTFALTAGALSANVSAEPRVLPVYRVIVNPSNPSVALDRSFLEDAFLKKISHWPSDQVIRPVDLESGSRTRRAFSDYVLRRTVDAVKGYWQQRIFSGRDVPPPELDTDDDVVKYVLRYEGAVGYVSGAGDLNGAKVVTIR